MNTGKCIVCTMIALLLLLTLPLFALAQSTSLEEQLAALLARDHTSDTIHGDSVNVAPVIIDVNVANGQAYFTFYDASSGDYFMAVRGTGDALRDLASQGYFSVHEEPALWGLTSTVVPDQQHWTVDEAAVDPTGSGLVWANTTASFFTTAWEQMYGTEPPSLGMPGTGNEYDQTPWTIVRTSVETYTPPGDTPPMDTPIALATGTPEPPPPTHTPRPTPTAMPTATPMPTPVECPPESFSQQPPAAIILDTSPPNPVVVSQGGQGLDVEARAVSYPVIHRWWTRERKWGCQWWDVDTYGVPSPNNGNGCCPEDQQLPGGGCAMNESDCWWVPAGDWQCVEHSEAIPDPILMEYFGATAFLRASSIEWIQTDLASKYPGARVLHPHWYASSDGDAIMTANGVCIAEYIFHFPFSDPGWYDVSVHGQTAGTMYTPPRSFSYTMPTPQAVYLVDTMLVH